MEKNYYLSRNYRDEGPYELSHLRLLYETGQLGADVYARKDGENEWVPLSVLLAAYDMTPPAPAKPRNLPDWRSLKGCGIAIQCLLILELVVLLRAKIAECAAFEECRTSAEPFDVAVESFANSIERINLFSPLIMAINISLIILSLFWIYKSAINANRMAWQAQRTLSILTPLVKPGRLIGSFFIPIYCFFKPYIDVKRIYNVSADPGNTRVHRFSMLVALWWASSLAAVFFDRWANVYLIQISKDLETEEEIMTMLDKSLDIELELCAFQVVAIACYYLLNRRVTSRQQQAIEASRRETAQASSIPLAGEAA